MGAVDAEVVIATFFNFYPDLVRRAMDGAWSLASPVDVLAARSRVVDRALRRGLGEHLDGAEMSELAGLVRRAAETAAQHPEGRPLFAGHAALGGPTSRTSSSGTRRRCCASSAATVTSPR